MEPTQTNPNRDPYLWKQAKARVAFKMYFRNYLIVNAGLWLIWALTNNFLRSSEHFVFPWPIFPTIGWGIGLASHYFAAYYSNNERSMIEQEYQKLANRQA